jgi:hypothetical protein
LVGNILFSVFVQINLFKQHLNAGAAREFWMYLDDYVKLRRPNLLPSRTAPSGGSSQHIHHAAAPSQAVTAGAR